MEGCDYDLPSLKPPHPWGHSIRGFLLLVWADRSLSSSEAI